MNSDLFAVQYVKVCCFLFEKGFSKSFQNRIRSKKATTMSGYLN